MNYFKKTNCLLIGLFLLTSISCKMGQSDYMSKIQQRRIKNAYKSLQTTYRRLVSQYDSLSGSMNPRMKSLYRGMQQMHSKMDMNHQQMMSMNMDRHMQQTHNKMRSIDMVIHLQDHKAGEWYQQMASMHNKMGDLHKKNGQHSMARLNRKLAQQYDEIRNMVPGLNRPSEVPFNEKGNPSFLNGKSLFADNCASCHGGNAKGIAGIFPPLVNSRWMSGDKSVPIRILLNGLRGKIEVSNQTYQGSMPSFRARLSAAEIASILNYVRSLYKEDLPKITQDDVIKTGKTYSDQVEPWRAEELK